MCLKSTGHAGAELPLKRVSRFYVVVKFWDLFSVRILWL